MDLHVLRSPDSENHIFSVWSLCLYVSVSLSESVSVSMCVTVINMAQKQIATETTNSIFSICIMCRWYLKFFMKIGQKLCVHGITKVLGYIAAYG